MLDWDEFGNEPNKEPPREGKMASEHTKNRIRKIMNYLRQILSESQQPIEVCREPNLLPLAREIIRIFAQNGGNDEASKNALLEIMNMGIRGIAVEAYLALVTAKNLSPEDIAIINVFGKENSLWIELATQKC